MTNGVIAEQDVAFSSSQNTERRTGPGQRATLSIGLAILGLFWCWQMRAEWSNNPQYLHGWGVPFLAGYLFWKRWEASPVMGKPARTAGLLIGGGLLLWAITHWLKAANPDWRMLHVGLTVAICWVIFGLLAWGGGWAWARHFVFPLAFLFTAVPWPTLIETRILGVLSQLVTSGSVELLQWLGVAAYQTGSVIHLENARLGVEEACSGMRSLQTAIMLGLFLGEFWQFRWSRRVMLLAAAVVMALLLNLTRTFILAYVATSSLAVAEKWHDPAGWAVLALLFFACTLGAWFLRERATLTGPAFFPVLSSKPVIVAGSFLVAVQLFTAFWYRAEPKKVAWSNLWPNSVPPQSMGERVDQVLKAAESRRGEISRPDGTHWTFYQARWEPGSAGAPQAKFHTPQICLPSIGLEKRSYRKFEPGEGLPTFQMYQFDYFGRSLFVFYIFFENGVPSSTGPVTYELALVEFDWRTRVQKALRGERLGRQELFEVAISNVATPELAMRSFSQFMFGGMNQ